MELSVFEKQYRELLADTDRRIEGVCGAMAPGGDGLVEPIRRIRDLLERQGAEVLEKGKLLQIGVMGQIKSGKSTFVNALLFGGKQVLPKGATPKTANLTVITYGEEDLLRVTFYTREEWEQLVSAAEHGSPSVALPARELLDQARAVGGGDDCIGTGTREIRFADTAALERQLGQYVGEAGVLAPFVKSAELVLHNELLRGLAIVDTPGLNDRIYSRVRQTQQYMEKCDVVFYLSAASDFMDTTDARLLFEQLPEQGVARLVLIASKYDSALMDAVWMKGGLEEAHRDSQRRLNRQAKAVVDRFVESSGSVRLADAVRACLPPLFVSSLVDAMDGRTYFSYTDEERRIYDGLAPDGNLSDEWLREISSFDKVRALYKSIVEDKQQTLARRGDQILCAARTQLDRAYESLDARLAGRSRLVEVPDELALEAIRLTYDRCRSRLEGGFRQTFDALGARLGSARDEALAELSAAADEAAQMQEHRSFRNIPKVERVSISKWYKPWTWGKYREIRTTEQEVYLYYSIEELTAQLERFARDGEALISGLLEKASDIDGVRRALLSHAMLVLGESEASFEPSYLRSLTEDAIRGLALEAPKVDIGGQTAAITARFGREAVGREQMEDVAALAVEAAGEVRQSLYADMSAQVDALNARVPELIRSLCERMTAVIQAELHEAEDRSRSREQYVRQIADARGFLRDEVQEQSANAQTAAAKPKEDAAKENKPAKTEKIAAGAAGSENGAAKSENRAGITKNAPDTEDGEAAGTSGATEAPGENRPAQEAPPDTSEQEPGEPESRQEAAPDAPEQPKKKSAGRKRKKPSRTERPDGPD